MLALARKNCKLWTEAFCELLVLAHYILGHYRAEACVISWSYFAQRQFKECDHLFTLWIQAECNQDQIYHLVKCQGLYLGWYTVIAKTFFGIHFHQENVAKTWPRLFGFGGFIFPKSKMPKSGPAQCKFHGACNSWAISSPRHCACGQYRIFLNKRRAVALADRSAEGNTTQTCKVKGSIRCHCKTC